MSSLKHFGFDILSDLYYLISLGVSRKDCHSFGRAQGRMHIPLGMSGVWHIAKSNRVWVWPVSNPAFLGLDTLPNPVTSRSG